MVILYLLPLLLANFLVVYAQLDVQCGSPTGKPAVITYTGDAKAVIAFTVGGKKCQFVEDTATASFKLTIGYKKAPGIDCLLEHTSPNRPSYGTIVETRLLHPLVEGGDDKKYVIECVFTPIKKDVTVKVNLEPKYNPPIFVLKSSGITSKSLFSLTLTNMLNQRFTTPVAESQIVKIRSIMTPRNGEKGYQPLECTAMSADQKVKLLILADGCGTGFPFKPTQGFQVKGIYGDSPNFRMFRIKKNQGVIFKCTFVICPSKCDENSCFRHPSIGRRKRDIHIRKRRSLGVKYNGLGLISHEESKGIDTAGIHHELSNETGTLTINKQNDKNLVFSDGQDSDGFNIVPENTLAVAQDSPLKTNDARAVELARDNNAQSDQGQVSNDELKNDFAEWKQSKDQPLSQQDDVPGAWESKEPQFDRGDQQLNEQSDKMDVPQQNDALETMADSNEKLWSEQSDKMDAPQDDGLETMADPANEQSDKMDVLQQDGLDTMADPSNEQSDKKDSLQQDDGLETMADRGAEQSDKVDSLQQDGLETMVDQSNEQSDKMDALQQDDRLESMADRSAEQSDKMDSLQQDGLETMADQSNEQSDEKDALQDGLETMADSENEKPQSDRSDKDTSDNRLKPTADSGDNSTVEEQEASTEDKENLEFTDTEDLKNAPVWNEPTKADNTNAAGDVQLANDAAEWTDDSENQEIPEVDNGDSSLTRVTSQVYKETGVDSNEEINNPVESLEPEVANVEPQSENENVEAPEIDLGEPDVVEPPLIRKKRMAMHDKGFILKARSETFSDELSDDEAIELPEIESGDESILTNEGPLPESQPEGEDVDSTDAEDTSEESEPEDSSPEVDEGHLQADALSKDSFSDSGVDVSTSDFLTSSNEQDDGVQLANDQQNSESAEQADKGDKKPNESDDEDSEDEESKDSENEEKEPASEDDSELAPESQQFTYQQDNLFSNDKPVAVLSEEKTEVSLGNDEPESMDDAPPTEVLEADAPLEQDEPESAPLFDDAAAGESTS